jgi:glucokinase
LAGRGAIGVDIGGTNVRLALFDSSGALVEKVSFDTGTIGDAAGLVRRLADAIKELSERTGAPRPEGVGVGSAGLLDVAEGRVLLSPNIHFLDGFPLGPELSTATGLPVRLENDANVFGLGEGWLGAAKGAMSFVAMTLGTGIGGAVVLDGRLWPGEFGTSGEIGHMLVEPGGLVCGCGAQGCLETVSAPGWMVKRAEAALKEGKKSLLGEVLKSNGRITGRDIFDACKKRDPLAEELFRAAGRGLGTAIVNIVNLLGLGLFVIGGGGAAGWECFFPHIEEELAARSRLVDPERVIIKRALLGGDAGLIGAASLFLKD